MVELWGCDNRRWAVARANPTTTVSGTNTARTSTSSDTSTYTSAVAGTDATSAFAKASTDAGTLRAHEPDVLLEQVG